MDPDERSAWLAEIELCTSIGQLLEIAKALGITRPDARRPLKLVGADDNEFLPLVRKRLRRITVDMQGPFWTVGRPGDYDSSLPTFPLRIKDLFKEKKA
jgi:hypothetical protein